MLVARRTILAFLLVAFALAAQAQAVTISFDYSTDTSNFFAPGSDARASLEAAGQFFSSTLDDDLEAIVPSGGNSWNATFTNPSTGAGESVNNLVVPADTLIVYVGARNLGGSTLGTAGPGGFSVGGTLSWVNTVLSRGEGDTTSPGAVDFGPWGGAVAIDSDSTWNLDHTVDPSAGQNDLFSVILHELAHVLGYGTSDSWDEQVSGNFFTGSASVAEFGGNVPLQPGGAHWAEGTTSTVFGGGPVQETAMDPTITTGTRKVFTDLDMAALSDIGWEVVPEPSAYLLACVALTGVLAFAFVRRRFKAA